MSIKVDRQNYFKYCIEVQAWYDRDWTRDKVKCKEIEIVENVQVIDGQATVFKSD